MKTLFTALAEELSAGRGAVVATVVASRGSTPRGPGAQMLVRADGSALGTVGGGAVELEAARLARDLCREGRSMTKTYRLTNTQAGDLGMVCGGEADILFQYVAPADLPQVQKILRALEDRTEPRWLVTAFALDSWRWGLCDGAGSCPDLGGIPGERLLPLLGKRPALGEGDPALFVQLLAPAGMVYLFGAGHVGLALVHLLALTEFPVVVYDQRPAPPDGIPEAVRVVQGPYEDALSRLEAIGPEDYICIMTRGHAYDTIVQAQALRTPACYIGVIGSKAKTAGVQRQLRTMGFTDEDFARITTPIGLDIKAETPAEIAISIAAQMIEVRAGRNAL